MTQITIQIKIKEEETFIETLLKKMQIQFQKSSNEKVDFELSEEMKQTLDERLMQDKNDAVNAWDSLKKIRAKYGV